MPSTPSLIKKLKTDFPQFNFCESDRYLWSHGENTIYFVPKDKYVGFLLHELSHALLNHADYARDVELLAMERQAWDKAKALAIDYDLPLDEDFIQTNLDTYRDWLHSRSTCPTCKANGMQIARQSYKCLACNHEWRVNEARTCALRRYGLKT